MTGRKADVLKAAWHASEIAQRLVKVGNKNWAITDAVSKVTSGWDCKPVEGMWLFLLFVPFLNRDQVCFLANNHRMSSTARSVSSSTLYVDCRRSHFSSTDLFVVGGSKKRVRDSYICRRRGLGYRHSRFVR